MTEVEICPTHGFLGNILSIGFLENYCLDCHDSFEEKGGVNLEELAFTIDNIETAELWQKVLNVVNSGEMPPKKEKKISPSKKTDFLADLSRQLVVARDALSDSGGVDVTSHGDNTGKVDELFV